MGVNHTAAQDLQPVVAFPNHNTIGVAATANVNLSRGFCKGEIAGTETDVHPITLKKIRQKGFQTAPEMAHGDAIFDDNPLNLMKHGGVGLVGIAAIGPARSQNPRRQRGPFQGMNLHARRMRAQQHGMAMGIRLIHIKGIMHLTRGMMGGEIQGAEIVFVILNIRSMVQDKTLAGKQSHNIIQRAAERVATPQTHSHGGQGHIKGLGLDLVLQGLIV